MLENYLERLMLLIWNCRKMFIAEKLHLKCKLYIFTGLMEAFAAIESILTTDGKIDKVKEEVEELRTCFDIITASYENDNYGDVRSYFVFSFQKAFDEWFKKVMEDYNFK